MGRRSTSSTKSGKFMNPTDQARKEARKRELKKNKKQRMMVRAAVLKMKDPRQIIRDMEKLDEMEFNPVQQPLLNEKVLRDKRKKLRETFERIVRLYERENPETYKDLRKLELEYESKRGQLALYFDSVKVLAVGATGMIWTMMTVTLRKTVTMRGMKMATRERETDMRRELRIKVKGC
uniref:Wbp11/ELF5/Saf1 N-terminal domain-containing protein n=1 Tax=Hippocampus comes TaxID=109280 RepID=A0A3Q2XV19_HIPCM